MACPPPTDRVCRRPFCFKVEIWRRVTQEFYRSEADPQVIFTCGGGASPERHTGRGEREALQPLGSLTAPVIRPFLT